MRSRKIFAAMSRWQPIASIVTIAPSIANISSSAGIATISLDFSDTLTCPSTSRWRAANAETIWIASCAPFFDHIGRHTGQPRHPRHEASLELLGVERRQNVAEVVVGRRSVANGRNRRNSSSFFSPGQTTSWWRGHALDISRRSRRSSTQGCRPNQQSMERILAQTPCTAW
jgi:hypothetical protein